MLEFIIDADVCLTDFIVVCLINFVVTINHAISEALSDARKHDFGHAISHVQSQMELSELDVRAHSQAYVTDHQLHNQVYCSHDNIDKRTTATKKMNVWYKWHKNYYQTLESEEDGMQNHVSRVYGNVWVLFLQFWTGLKDFNDSKHSYPCTSKC